MGRTPFQRRPALFLFDIQRLLADTQCRLSGKDRTMLFGTYANPLFVRSAAFHVPQEALTSCQLEEKFALEQGRIMRTTGVEARYLASLDETTEHLAVCAAQKALAAADVCAANVDLLVVGTFTPSTHLPGIASVIADRLGLSNCSGTIDVNTSCTSGLQAFIEAAGHLAISDAKLALVVASDTATGFMDWSSPRGVTTLLGDAAAAVVLAKDGPGVPVRAYALEAAPEHWEAIILRRKGTQEEFIEMQGRRVFDFAVRSVPPFVCNILERSGKVIKDVDLLIMHHANGRIIDAVEEKLSCPVFSNIRMFGNTSSAATLAPFADAWLQKRIRSDMTTVLASFGAGMTLCGVVLGS
jgi:3-oxoacyl-[acyl-carrier-protein] synthase-3